MVCCHDLPANPQQVQDLNRGCVNQNVGKSKRKAFHILCLHNGFRFDDRSSYTLRQTIISIATGVLSSPFDAGQTLQLDIDALV